MSASLQTFTPADATLPRQPPTSVLLVGLWQHGEFARIRGELDATSDWPTVPTLRDAVARLTNQASAPEIVLLAQRRPGVDDQAIVEQLRHLAPLMRLIVVAGSWCEGELRTGRPLSGVVRLYWYELPAWWRAARRQLALGECPPWAQPVTDLRAGQTVRFEADDIDAIESEYRGLAIDARDYATFEALAGGLNQLRWACRWQPRHRPELAKSSLLAPRAEPPLAEREGYKREGYKAGLWDGGQLDADELEDLREFCCQMRAEAAPVLVLLDFPRVEHLAAIEQAGAAAVLGKPYQLALMHQELCRLTTRPPALCE